MRRIEKLPEIVANQIAAGEVVLRPANVVKELVENAIDANARNVHIESAGGGIARVFIVDDGHGMTRDDARLCIERHATSKLRSADDLESLQTLGFRGEALPSIAAVSRLVIRTRSRHDDEGTEIVVHGGTLDSVSPCGCPPGTSVAIEDLFFNVPARRKFLRALSTESAHITEVIRGAALAHPTVSFRHRRDGREVQRYLAATERADRAAAVLSCPRLVQTQGSRGPIEVEAHLAPADEGRSRASGLFILVNHRPVQERAIVRAVANAYGDSLPQGRYPVGVVYIELPPDLVDVNVHPQKAEVRFAHARAVTDAIYSVIVKTMGTRTPHTHHRAREDHAMPGSRPVTVTEDDGQAWTWSGSREERPMAAPLSCLDPARGIASASTEDDEIHKNALLGISHGRFLLVQEDDELLILDGHGLQQLDFHHTARAELARGSLISQLLLFPVDIPLRAETLDLVQSQFIAALKLGFDFERANDDALRVRAVPRCLATAATELLAHRWVEALDEGLSEPHDVLARLSAALPCPTGLSLERAITLLRAWRDWSPTEKDQVTSLQIDRAELERA